MRQPVSYKSSRCLLKLHKIIIVLSMYGHHTRGRRRRSISRVIFGNLIRFAKLLQTTVKMMISSSTMLTWWKMVAHRALDRALEHHVCCAPFPLNRKIAML